MGEMGSASRKIKGIVVSLHGLDAVAEEKTFLLFIVVIFD
jgi:hypothetical protein